MRRKTSILWLLSFRKQFVTVQVQQGHNQQHERLSNIWLWPKKIKQKKGKFCSFKPQKGCNHIPCWPDQPLHCSLLQELGSSCQRRGSLYLLLETGYLTFHAEISPIARGSAPHCVTHQVSISRPKTHTVFLETGGKVVGSLLLLPYDRASCTSPSFLSSSCI